MYSLIFTSVIAAVISFGAHAADPAAPKALPKAKRTPSNAFQGDCYSTSPTKMPGVDQLFLQAPRQKGQGFTVFLTAYNKSGSSWTNEFQCAREKERAILCRGHDDSGTFRISFQLLDATMKISSVGFGNPDNEGPEYTAPSEDKLLKVVLGKVSCN